MVSAHPQKRCRNDAIISLGGGFQIKVRSHFWAFAKSVNNTVRILFLCAEKWLGIVRFVWTTHFQKNYVRTGCLRRWHSMYNLNVNCLDYYYEPLQSFTTHILQKLRVFLASFFWQCSLFPQFSTRDLFFSKVARNFMKPHSYCTIAIPKEIVWDKNKTAVTAVQTLYKNVGSKKNGSCQTNERVKAAD